MTTPLRKFDLVHLFSNKRQFDRETGVAIDECEISQVGAAGFRVTGGKATYWWHDRGKTWSSQALDRVDETRKRFSEVAKMERTK